VKVMTSADQTLNQPVLATKLLTAPVAKSQRPGFVWVIKGHRDRRPASLRTTNGASAGFPSARKGVAFGARTGQEFMVWDFCLRFFHSGERAWKNPLFNL